MADHNIVVGVDINSTTTGLQGLTPRIWKGIDPVAASFNPMYGSFHLERWRTWGEAVDASPVRNGSAILTRATAGTATVLTGPAGFGSILELDSESSTDNQGANLMFDSLRFTPEAGAVVAFEAMIRAKDIATGPQFFAGLAVPTSTAIITSGALATNIDRLGFSSVTDNSVVILSACDGTTADVSGTVHTLVDGATTTSGAEWVRLGIRWEYGVKIEATINGVLADTSALSITAEPDGVVAPAFVCQSAGTTDPIIEIAYFAFGYVSK
jgi:hypothetical protein